MISWFLKDNVTVMQKIQLCLTEVYSVYKDIFNSILLLLSLQVPAGERSTSFFTKAFLFSSRSWLGIRPALPPSTWRACGHITYKQVTPHIFSSLVIISPGWSTFIERSSSILTKKQTWLQVLKKEMNTSFLAEGYSSASNLTDKPATSSHPPG